MTDSVLIADPITTKKLNYDELKAVPAPASTATHQVIPHHQVIDQLTETLAFRHIAIHSMEFAVSKDGNKMFGLMDLDQTFTGCRFALGVRNSHDRTMRLAMTVGYKVLVCSNMSFHGDFQPVLAKHSKHFSLTNALSIGIDQMQRTFKPMVEQVEAWRSSQISDITAKLLIYQAFVEGELDAPRHLDRITHEQYFNPHHEDFAPRTMWSLSNAFTSAFKELDPIPQFRATAKLGPFLEARHA